jgi:hypothetical protein
MTAAAVALLLGLTALGLALVWRDVVLRRLDTEKRVEDAKAERIAEWGELVRRVQHLEDSQPIGGARQGRRVV